MSKKNIEQENETEKVSNKPAQTAAPESAPQPPEDPEKNHRGPAGKIVLTVFLAIAIVAGVSFMPLERWTGGRVKNFSLIRDILPDSLLPSDSASTGETVDPELLKAEAVAKNLDAQGNPLYTDTIIGEPQPSQVNGQTVIEDYTDGSVGLYHLRRAIADPRRARIAVVGDSYIEGDIMTQDLREMLQGAYGGTGTGYMSMYSAFPGFRRSVRQGGDGWTALPKGKKSDKRYISLSEQYFMPKGNALSTYAGVKQPAHLDTWDRSRFLFISPANTTVMTKTSGNWTEHKITGSPNVQAIEIEGPTSEFDIKVTDPKLAGLGVWLESAGGIGVDCLSSRGKSGIALASVDRNLCRQMAKWADYDLIILEFGINALTAKQTNYDVYMSHLVEVINNVRQCYPNADIMLMGIGDRGEKKGGEVKSMSTARFMVDAQRQAARRAHCLFWDTRAAMGGDGAIVAWASDGRANKDYIHLTHKGGKELATYLFNALQNLLK